LSSGPKLWSLRTSLKKSKERIDKEADIEGTLRRIKKEYSRSRGKCKDKLKMQEIGKEIS
jgi:hypothetical protein